MRRASSGRLLAIVFVVAALAAIGVGLVIIGPPWVQREIAMDARRASDLDALDWGIRAYRDAHGSMPPALEALGEEWDAARTDPETGRPYEYEPVGDAAYRICAVFARESGAAGDPRWAQDFMRHGAGRHCFEREVPDDGDE